MTINQVEKFFTKRNIKYCRRQNAISYSVIADCMVGIVERNKQLFFKIAKEEYTVIMFPFSSIEYDDENLYFKDNSVLTVRIP